MNKAIDKSKSLKPKKKIDKNQRGYGLKTIEVYNEINLLYGVLAEFCTVETCPLMSAGPKYEYLWADGANVKTPLKVSASEYIDFLMTWVEN